MDNQNICSEESTVKRYSCESIQMSLKSAFLTSDRDH